MKNNGCLFSCNVDMVYVDSILCEEETLGARVRNHLHYNRVFGIDIQEKRLVFLSDSGIGPVDHIWKHTRNSHK